MKRKLLLTLTLLALIFTQIACDFESVESGTKQDTTATKKVAADLQLNQPSPTDIDYSIPRWLLTRRAYFVNGQREKARTLPCPIADIPLGHVVLLTESGAVVGKFIVEGMVISLHTYLTPDSDYYEITSGSSTYKNKWLADIDGTYGENDDGIFFFTPDGLYMEWNGLYLYTDMPIMVDHPIVKTESLVHDFPHEESISEPELDSIDAEADENKLFDDDEE